jgi:hypothetical protein
LQSIIGHVNATIDKTILGIYSTKENVAIYSVANTFVTFFNTVPSVISSVFLPSAVKLVVAKVDNEALTDFVIKPGCDLCALGVLRHRRGVQTGSDLGALLVFDILLTNNACLLISLILCFCIIPRGVHPSGFNCHILSLQRDIKDTRKVLQAPCLGRP